MVSRLSLPFRLPVESQDMFLTSHAFYQTLAILSTDCLLCSCALNHTLLHYAILAIVVCKQYHDELGITSPDTLSEFFHFWFSLLAAGAFSFTPPETISITTFITRDTILTGQHMWLDTAHFTTVKFHVSTCVAVPFRN